MKKIYTAVACLLTMMANAQTTVNLAADKDNTLFLINVNGGNGAGDGIFIGLNASGEIRRGLIYFNLASIPANANITAASLKLTVQNVANNSNGLNLYKASASWGEGSSIAGGGNEGQAAPATTNDATWTSRFHPATAWGSPGGDYSGSTSASVSTLSLGVVNLSGANLLNDVKGWYASPATNNGWILIATNESQNRSARKISSREAGASLAPTLTITYTIALPVSLKSFTGKIKNNNAVLNWITASELNNESFDVLHSSNGRDFTAVGNVRAAGTGNIENSYGFVHSNLSPGKHYYRLLQKDKDGRSHNSEVILLQSGKAQLALQLQPNPAVSSIKLLTAENVTGSSYKISRADGMVVQKGVVTNQQVDVRQLPAGQYYISLLSGDGVMLSSAFIKQ